DVPVEVSEIAVVHEAAVTRTVDGVPGSHILKAEGTMEHRQLAIAALVFLPALAAGECLSDSQARAFVDHYVARTPADNVVGQSEADAACSRAKITGLLRARLGDPIGYKVGLTNPALRRMLKGTAPVWGVFYPGDFA